jgi:hypothetical protein
MATCINHPERAAVEHCEVCNNPLCAFCLYYTSDGQRLCKLHADQAEAAGAFIRNPSNYAGGLIASQVSAGLKKKESEAQYEGNSADLMALIGMILGIISLSICIPGSTCLIGPIGIVLSVVALTGAKDARNPSRTRTMAGVGLTLSILWIIMMLLCIFTWFIPFFSLQSFSSTNTITIPRVQLTRSAPTQAPFISPTDTPSLGR